jgi:hypothetical protein
MSGSGTCATVATAEVDLGWLKIKGHKTEQIISGGVQGGCVVWQYSLDCCVIQIFRYAHVVEWAAFSKDTSEAMQVKRGVKPTAETSQIKIQREAVTALFGIKDFGGVLGFLGGYALDIVRQCDEKHAENNGDMTMSLNGCFEPFPFERKQVLS